MTTDTCSFETRHVHLIERLTEWAANQQGVEVGSRSAHSTGITHVLLRFPISKSAEVHDFIDKLQRWVVRITSSDGSALYASGADRDGLRYRVGIEEAEIFLSRRAAVVAEAGVHQVKEYEGHRTEIVER